MRFGAVPLLVLTILAIPPAQADDGALVERSALVEQLRPTDGPRYRSLAATVSVPPRVALDIRFTFDSADLTDEARAQLDEVGSALVSDVLASFRFDIEGHTDATGHSSYNLELSQRRADAVKAYLVSNFGISPARLTALGKGETQLRDTDKPDSGDNRRVEIVNRGD